MRVLINTSGTIFGGALTHLRNLLPLLCQINSQDEFLLAANDSIAAAIGFVPGLKRIDTAVNFSSTSRRLTWESTVLPRIVTANAIDIVFHPTNIPLFRCPVPHVNLVHNMAPFMPAIIEEESARQRMRLRLLRSLTILGFNLAARTIFISEWGKRVALRAAGCRHDPGPVIPFGADYRGQRSNSNLFADLDLEKGLYLLSVSHFYRYKRLEHLVRAYVDLGPLVADFPLVLVGAPCDAQYTYGLKELASDAQGRVVFTGALDAGAVYELLGRCAAFVFTSEAENLPIALLEAMCFGAPILTSRACSMPEVCGDAAIYVDSADSDGYRSKLSELLRDESLRRKLSGRSRARSRLFTWDRAALATLAILHEAIGDNQESSRVFREAA